MIPALIFYLIRRFKGKSRAPFNLEISKAIVLKLIILLGLILMTSSFVTLGSNKSLTYNVVRNNKVIGAININKSTSQSTTIYTLSSTIKANLLVKFNVEGKERAIYKNGILVYSSVYRALNNKVKVNHNIELEDNQYHVKSSNETKSLECSSITHSLITLYFQEPIGVTSVFCDNQKAIVPVVNLSKGKYKVEIAKGKYNIFHYKHGVCVKVEAVSKLFNVILIPVES